MIKNKNYVNQKFNKLTVIKKDNKDLKGEHWFCKCSCENDKYVRVSIYRLKSNHTKSCGCLQKEKVTKNNISHNLWKSPEYSNWNSMIKRCYNKNNSCYKNYGGRGITVCDRWRDPIQGLKNFIKDMGPKPSNEYSIDRIDNDGNYEPSNCRWATQSEQCQNQRTNVIKNIQEANEIRIKYNTNQYTQEDLAKEYKCSIGTISLVVNNKQWKINPTR
ncbi:MAG: hypothetical protein H8E98_02745 [Bacteroidetes bacterium]|nr:hypothetical protein [Bacteroidota bacterium]